MDRQNVLRRQIPVPGPPRIRILEIQLALEQRLRTENPLLPVLGQQMPHQFAHQIARIQPVERLEKPVRLRLQQQIALVMHLGRQRLLHRFPRPLAVDHGRVRDAPLEQRRQIARHQRFAVHDEHLALEARHTQQFFQCLKSEPRDQRQQPRRVHPLACIIRYQIFDRQHPARTRRGQLFKRRTIRLSNDQNNPDAVSAILANRPRKRGNRSQMSNIRRN